MTRGKRACRMAHVDQGSRLRKQTWKTMVQPPAPSPVAEIVVMNALVLLKVLFALPARLLPISRQTRRCVRRNWFKLMMHRWRMQ